MAEQQNQTHPNLRPGERMLAGRVYVFNAEMLNDHLAREAVHAAVDLEALSLDQLIGLRFKAFRLMVQGDPDQDAANALSKAINAEMARRGLETTGLKRAVEIAQDIYDQSLIDLGDAVVDLAVVTAVRLPDQQLWAAE